MACAAMRPASSNHCDLAHLVKHTARQCMFLAQPHALTSDSSAFMPVLISFVLQALPIHRHHLSSGHSAIPADQGVHV